MLHDANYKFLYHFTRALQEQQPDVSGVFKTVLTLTGEALRIQHGCLLTFVDHTRIDRIYLLGADHKVALDEPVWDTLVKRGPVGYAYHSDRPIVIRNIVTDPRRATLPPVSFLPATGSVICLPLSKGNHKFGVLLLAHPEVDYFNRQRVELLEEMHSVASSALAAALELQAARTGDTRYHALFDGGVVPIILTDVHGVIQDVNQKACDFLGYPRSALVRVLLSDIYTAGAGAPALTAETLLPEGTQETSIRTTLHDVDGKSIPSLVRVRRVRLDGRMVIEWVFQDVTAQTELEQLRKDLSAMVYHDLRAPLTNIVGSIYKLNTVLQNHENPIVPRLLHIGLRSTRQLQRMVDSLLDIQRLEEGKALLNRQPVEVRVLLADAVQLVQPIATEAGQQILFEAGKDVPTVALDSDMIMRVIINLMENAVKYTPTAGSIRVTAHRDGDGLLFKVSDSGPGIPKEMLGRVFDKFSRVRHQGAPKGVGLGLAFCRLAVEAHGGKIWVESEPGHGSDFMFRLPIVEPAPPEAKVATPPEEARPEPEKPRSAADTHPVHPRLASA